MENYQYNHCKDKHTHESCCNHAEMRVSYFLSALVGALIGSLITYGTIRDRYEPKIAVPIYQTNNSQIDMRAIILETGRHTNNKYILIKRGDVFERASNETNIESKVKR